MMALDGKTIKEEIPDRDPFDGRKNKGKDQCRTPDSPEGARVVTPRSPQQRSRNGCNSPTKNSSSGSITPPPLATPASLNTSTGNHFSSESGKLTKIRRFLGALVQFGQDTNPDVGDRIRSLVLSIASNNLSIDEFQVNLQEVTNFPLRTNVAPFLRSHIPILQREIQNLARSNKLSALTYVRQNETCVFEIVPNQNEHVEIFSPSEGSFTNLSSIPLKRRASDTIYDVHSNSSHDWNDYTILAKRPVHQSFLLSSTPQLYSGHPSIFDYQNGLQTHTEVLQNQRDRDDRDIRQTAEPPRSSRPKEDEDWRNIHSMLTCISGMVEKTKRAISILQQRGVEPHPTVHDPALDIRRQTEEKIAEFRRNAEESVNQVKRQAVIEIQRAVAAAENRALELIAAERLKMEKMLMDYNRANTESEAERQSPQAQGTQNACWNCGRKANETCSGCNLARYCGAFCQHKDWEQHHKVCGTLCAPDRSKNQTPTPTLVAPLSNGVPLPVTTSK